MFTWIPAVPYGLEIIILIGGAVSVIYGAYRTVWKPLKGFKKKVVEAVDSLTGFDPIMDPASGKELKPATPPLSHRVSNLEDAFSTMIQTQNDIVGLQRDLSTISVQLQDMTKVQEERMEQGTKIIEDWTIWREEQDSLTKLIREQLKI